MVTRLKLFIYSKFLQGTSPAVVADALSVAAGVPGRWDAIGQVLLIYARHMIGEYRSRDRIGRIAFVIAHALQLLIVLALVVFVCGLLWLL